VEDTRPCHCGGDLCKKELSMFTLFVLFVLFGLLIPLGLIAQRWLFQETHEVSDPEWAVYEQRHD
jgi:hypothetical protein